MKKTLDKVKKKLVGLNKQTNKHTYIYICIYIYRHTSLPSLDSTLFISILVFFKKIISI